MTKKYIKQIALASYTKNKLDSIKVKRIVHFLTRHDLKQYIRELKLLENEKSITVVTPFINAATQNDVKKQFAKVFAGKKVIISTDPSLILGVKVINNDLIYDLSLQSTLNNLNVHIKEQYD
jgi:F0F1-type ATP synthase delta subunit